MSKRLFDANGVPTEPQSSGLPDFADDSASEANPYIMKGRLTAGVSRGAWSIVNLTDYQHDIDVEGDWRLGDNASKLFNQVSNIASDSNGVVTANKFYDNSPHTYVQYVKEVTVNLDEGIVKNAPVTGVDVWFRWMPSTAFSMYVRDVNGKITGTTDVGYRGQQDVPDDGWQKRGPSTIEELPSTAVWEPTEWSFIGTRFEPSFSVTVPMAAQFKTWEGIWAANQALTPPTKVDKTSKTAVNNFINSNFPEMWFQIIVTGHSTWKPDRYNYRWVGEDVSDSYNFIDIPTWESTKQYWTRDSAGIIGGGIYYWKVGERFTAKGGSEYNYQAIGYLPWNPHYGASKTDRWNTYRRQRNTFGDVAIFAPRRWRKWAV